MGLDVRFTVRSQTHQTRLDGFQFGLQAEITLHIPRHRKTEDRRGCFCFWCFFLHSLYNFSQHSASAQSWSWGERLPALGAAVNSILIIPIPALINTVHTETMPTRCSYWVVQKMKTDRTVKGVLIVRRFCHFAAMKTVEKLQVMLLEKINSHNLKLKFESNVTQQLTIIKIFQCKNKMCGLLNIARLL